MAGSQDPNENPVAINVVPMVDVIFCLCVFFMCSFKFKQIEGKFDTWLPRDKGAQGMPLNSVIEEMRVALFWNEQEQITKRKWLTKWVPDDANLQSLIQAARDDYLKLNKPDVAMTIDAEPKVPWKEIVTVLNLAKRCGVEKVEFAFGLAPPGVKPN